MREIASFPDERAAKLFADVLCTRSIDTEISRTKGGEFVVWVLEERHIEVSRAAWAAFDANPEAPEHAAAAGCVERKTRKEEVEQRRSRHEIINVRGAWGVSPAHRATLTVIMVALSVGVTLVDMLNRRPDLISYLQIGPVDEVMIGQPFWHVLHGEVWRLITPIFVHYGLAHIFFNMWWLVDMGSVIESRIGTLRFGLLVLLTAAFSNAAQYAWVGSPRFGGMSGVIYALFGYIWARGKLDATFGLKMPPTTIVILLVWMLLGFAHVLENVANVTHLGGLISGGVIGVVAALLARA